MAVLKQTFADRRAHRAKAGAFKKVPSANINPPRENTLAAGAAWALDASVMGGLEFARK
jgi:hypothetical protein